MTNSTWPRPSERTPTQTAADVPSDAEIASFRSSQALPNPPISGNGTDAASVTALAGRVTAVENSKISAQQADVQFADPLAAMNAHFARTDNPHGVMAAQIGAAPASALAQKASLASAAFLHRRRRPSDGLRGLPLSRLPRRARADRHGASEAARCAAPEPRLLQPDPRRPQTRRTVRPLRTLHRLTDGHRTRKPYAPPGFSSGGAL